MLHWEWDCWGPPDKMPVSCASRLIIGDLIISTRMCHIPGCQCHSQHCRVFPSPGGWKEASPSPPLRSVLPMGVWSRVRRSRSQVWWEYGHYLQAGMQLVWDEPAHPYCRTSEDLFSGTKFPSASKNVGLTSSIPRDVLSPCSQWHTGTAAPSNEYPSLVTLPQIIPQAEFNCLPHCLHSVFDIALCLLHKHGQARFPTPRSSQTNYTVMRGCIPTVWFRTQCRCWAPQGPAEQMSAQSHKASMEIKSVHRVRKKSTHAGSAFIVCIICPST